MFQMPRLDRNLWILDTAVTLGPLLGLLGTIIGMVESFSVLGTSGTANPNGVTGGIGHALTATACGLTIAIVCVIFLNYFNKRIRMTVNQFDLIKSLLVSRFAGLNARFQGERSCVTIAAITWREEKARIEIIPMIDIMMFLLVFFMLATLKMIQGAGIKLDLPQSSTAEQLQQTVKVSIGVTKTDEIYLDAKPVTPTELTAHLQGLVHDSKKVDVAIAGDEGTSYKNIVKVMDLVRAAGISSVALATNPTT